MADNLRDMTGEEMHETVNRVDLSAVKTSLSEQMLRLFTLRETINNETDEKTRGEMCKVFLVSLNFLAKGCDLFSIIDLEDKDAPKEKGKNELRN